MTPPPGNWQEFKIYEGAQIYVNLDNGRFGAYLKPTSNSWMINRDLQMVQMAVRKFRGGLPVIIVGEQEFWKQELVACEKETWITRDGKKWLHHAHWVYRFDQALFDALQDVRDRWEEVKKQDAQMSREWFATHMNHQGYSPQTFDAALQAHRAQQESNDTAEPVQEEHTDGSTAR